MSEEHAKEVISIADGRRLFRLLRALAQRIRGHRVRHSLKRLTVAHACRASEAAVGRWERGESAPRLDQLLDLADLFRVSLDLLLRGPLAVRRSARSEERR
jgi:transcriptional regulator with XRE-family HTH domain